MYIYIHMYIYIYQANSLIDNSCNLPLSRSIMSICPSSTQSACARPSTSMTEAKAAQLQRVSWATACCYIWGSAWEIPKWLDDLFQVEVMENL